MHERKHGSKRCLAIGAGDAEMQRRSLWCLHAHHLYRTFRIGPGPVRRKRKFDLRSKTFRALRELDRRSRMVITA